MDVVELLIGIAEIATALAGFGFLLEASLATGGFSLFARLIRSALRD